MKRIYPPRDNGRLSRVEANHRLLFVGCKRSIDAYLGGNIGRRPAKRNSKEGA